MLAEILEGTGLFPANLVFEMSEPFLSGKAAHHWLVAEAEDVIGFAYAEPERLTDGTHNLLAIAVLPNRQNVGVGKALVEGLSERLHRQGSRILLVETSSLDAYTATRGFYAGLAFQEVARIPDFYTDGEDKIVFWKRLR